jgi:hypothetical protein
MVTSESGRLKLKSTSVSKGKTVSMKTPPRLILVIRFARNRSRVEQFTWIATL